MPLNNPITSALLADPEIFQQNRLPFHAHFADQTSPEMPLTVSLDGEWNFRYAENLTAPFTDWDTLTVPGFIQMQSLQKPGKPYGTPHYVNTQYPWDGHEKLRPGEIPQDYNPIGEYQRSFTLPESWASCYLRLNGADSAAAVWCNGVYIGYTEDTFTPAEFDMTAAVHPGENTLTVQVYRFSSGSWLEDQDFWRFSGIFRDVFLYAAPSAHVRDMRVIADVDEADIGDVKEGERVSFTVDDYPDDTFSGTVTQVRQEATTTNNVVTYEVVISAPNKDLKLKPGLTANVTIYTLEKSNVLSVPNKALRFTPTKELIGDAVIKDCKGSKKVWTFSNNVFEAHPVTVGISDGINTELLGGIKKGAKIITEIKVGMGNGGNAVPPSEASVQESSPFAPKGPGQNKKK